MLPRHPPLYTRGFHKYEQDEQHCVRLWFFFLLNMKKKLMIQKQLHSGTNEGCAVGWKVLKSFNLISCSKWNKLKVLSFSEIQENFALLVTLFYCTYFCNYDKNLCNKNQLDTIFILSLFRQSTSTCFGHICSPSSGGILYIYNNWCVLSFLTFRRLMSTIDDVPHR